MRYEREDADAQQKGDGQGQLRGKGKRATTREAGPKIDT